MAKSAEKEKAIEFRKQGLSYNEIRGRVSVSKSTLSLWLRSVGLAKRHIRRLTERQLQTQKMAVAKWHTIRVEKTLCIKRKAEAEISYLSKREKWLIGIALYWAEGSKEHEKGSLIKLSNSDPAMIILFREWILDFLCVNPSDIVYELFIHEKSENIASAMQFWCSFLHIDPAELRLYLKKHNPSPKRKNIDVNYKGLVRLVVRRSTDMNRKISGWIEGIISQYHIIGE